MSEAAKELSFEENLAKLEQLVAKMESGKLPIEELIADFEEGSRLVKLCRSRLNALERKIEVLTRDDQKDGQWAEFDPDADGAKR